MFWRMAFLLGNGSTNVGVCECPTLGSSSQLVSTKRSRLLDPTCKRSSYQHSPREFPSDLIFVTSLPEDLEENLSQTKNKRQDVNFHFVNSLTFCQNTKDGDLVGICTDSGGGCKVVGHKGVRPVSPPFAVLVDVWPKCGQFDSGQNKSGLRLSPPMSEDRIQSNPHKAR